MSFVSLKRRVEALERPTGVQRSAEELALEILDDTEMGLVAEFVALHKSGYGSDQIRQMMGQECYTVACDAIKRTDQEYWRLMRPYPRPFWKAIDDKRDDYNPYAEDSRRHEDFR